MTKLSTLYIAIIVSVAASNFLVQFPLNDWLTLGAFTYPLSFLVNELTNQFYGPQKARRVITVGFIMGLILSIILSTPKIAFASGVAYLVSQLADIAVFSRFRRHTIWWFAPFLSSFAASVIDTSLFFGLAFWGEDLPILTWALGDFSVKLCMDLAMLTPFRLALRRA